MSLRDDDAARYRGHESERAERDYLRKLTRPYKTNREPEGLTARTQPDISRKVDDGNSDDEKQTGVQSAENGGTEPT